MLSRNDSLCKLSAVKNNKVVSNGTRQCISCPYDCLICNSLEDCLNCSYEDDHRYLDIQNKRCVPVAGFFDNLTTVALPCFTGCEYCSSDTSCIVCTANLKKGPGNLCYKDCPAGTFNNTLYQIHQITHLILFHR